MPRGRPKHPDILTPREWEVLALLREGLTNEQIGERLQISENGAKYHVLEILSKLGVSSRYEAAAWQRGREPVASRRFAGLAAIFALRPPEVGGISASKVAMATLVVTVFGFMGLLAVGVLVMNQRETGSELSPDATSEAAESNPAANPTSTPTPDETATQTAIEAAKQNTPPPSSPASTPEPLSSTGQFMASLPQTILGPVADFAASEGGVYAGPCTRSTADGEFCMFNVSGIESGKAVQVELRAFGSFYGVTLVPDGSGGYQIESAVGPEPARPE